MAHPPKDNRPQLPAPRANPLAPRKFNYRPSRPPEVVKLTEDHAQEVRSTLRGQDDINVDPNAPKDKKSDLPKVGPPRQMMKGLPLDPHAAAATRVPYPRLWNTQRGRYSQFRAGKGVFALIRSRPTF